jgi:hypothetical protein
MFEMSAANASTPQGIYDPVFSDGTDVPGAGKTINPNNRWARYVFAAVDRYRPGGVLAGAVGWSDGEGITHWEIWNEQDFDLFWTGTLADYARLLKVGYLAAKQADPNAQVLFGGLANNQQLSFLNDVLTIYDGDPLAVSNDYFFDILATHSYSRSWDSWLHVWRGKQSMTAHGLDKPVWLNETGVPAWDDYPGPMWAHPPDFPWAPFWSTMSEQADYTIQTVFYAVWAGAEAIFHFQLYDGCANDPAGSNPPYDPTGGHCSWYSPCFGDAHGFYSNPSDAVCFANHPQPETARPKLAAMDMLTAYMQDVVPLWRRRVGSSDPLTAPQEWFAFYRPSTNERIIALWARYGQDETAIVPKVNPAGTATLVSSTGITQTITATNGTYTVNLPGATNLNTPLDSTGAYAIGGRPFMIVEKVSN